MSANLNKQELCNVIDISKREYDFNAFIPSSHDNLSEQELAEIERVEAAQRAGQGDDELPVGIFNDLLKYFLDNHDYRSALWVTLQANTGLRYVDISKFRKIELINENNLFRESILDSEQKTGKKRINFINDAIKMATLLYLWDNPETKSLDYLIVADKNAPNRGYKKETYIDSRGNKRVKRENGKYIYVLDSNGNKIVEPLSIQCANEIIKKALVDGLGIAIKNSQEKGGYLKIATHSLRKTYSAAVVDYYTRQFDTDKEYAHAAAMEQLQYDLNHSSRKMTYHYIGDYVETKRSINMSMNLGIDVLKPVFDVEKEKRK